jgi:hypothetical protein
MEFKLGISAVTLLLPGRPLRGSPREKGGELKSLIDMPRKELAKMRRKFKPFYIFTNACVVRQMGIRNGIAYQKIHIIADATEKQVTVLQTYWVHRYHWSPTRIFRRFDNFSEAVLWLMPKACHQLECWETTADLDLLLNLVRHVPLISGLGDFRRTGKSHDSIVKEGNDYEVA